VTTQPAFRRSEPDARRLSLIEACARVLAREGIAGASVRTIAVEAGVSAGLVGHYFAGVDALIAAFKLALGDAVKDVRTSHRLTDSPVCLIADEGAMDMHLERLLKAHNQIDTSSPRILEINPKHALIKNLAGIADVDAKDTVLNDAAYLLLDQARIVEGEPVLDPQAFTRRMTAVMQKGIAA